MKVNPVPADLLRAADLPHEATIEAKYGLLQQIHEKLESWSQSVWTVFNVRSAQLSEAFTAGASLADTYWYASLPQQGEELETMVSGRPPQDSLSYLLQKGRLDYTIDRLQAIEDQFAPLVIPIVVHSLKKWGVAEKLAQLSPKQQRQVYRNLESQTRD